MSVAAQTQVAVLAPRARRESRARLTPARASRRPGVRLASFLALGLFGTLSWSRLLSDATDERRLLGLLVLAGLLAGAGMGLVHRHRVAFGGLGVVSLLGALALSGLPLTWLVHGRVAVSARAVGDGLSALPGLLVPYLGINQWVRMVIVLGAGVLLLDAAVLFVLAPRSAGLLRRCIAALPLVALATVPDTAVAPRFAYLDGAVLFVLLAAYLWGDRVHGYELASALALGAVATVAAMVIAPGIDRHAAWIDTKTLAGKLAPGRAETFDWQQTYGPIAWPRDGQAVLSVMARHADYWKAENLDAFNGRAWTSSSVAAAVNPLTGVTPASLARWTQRLEVTLGPMQSFDIIGAGVAPSPPSGLQTEVLSAGSPGTWITQTGLGRGDSYGLTSYDPRPSAAQLAGAGTDYPQPVLADYLTLALRHSIYAPAEALAHRLVSRSPTPYAYVLAVKRYLATGYSYTERPPASRYPIETFLFGTRTGYCQQFAGAMGLLLRLGGVPARVAVGFTPGSYDSATGRWLVADTDAHAWVEAFFPSFGWVRFDPTPAADPALGGHLAALPALAGGGAAPSTGVRHRSDAGAPAGPARGRPAGAGRSASVDPLVVLGALALALLSGLAALVARPARSLEARLAELERAFTRTGRPLSPATTLAELERRLSGSPQAQAYVHELGLERFAGVGSAPTSAQRRALRRALRDGLGLTGAVRAWWALPPRRSA